MPVSVGFTKTFPVLEQMATSHLSTPFCSEPSTLLCFHFGRRPKCDNKEGEQGAWSKGKVFAIHIKRLSSWRFHVHTRPGSIITSMGSTLHRGPSLAVFYRDGSLQGQREDFDLVQVAGTNFPEDDEAIISLPGAGCISSTARSTDDAPHATEDDTSESESDDLVPLPLQQYGSHAAYDGHPYCHPGYMCVRSFLPFLVDQFWLGLRGDGTSADKPFTPPRTSYALVRENVRSPPGTKHLALPAIDPRFDWLFGHEGSERDADGLGDRSEDEYAASQPPHPKKRSRENSWTAKDAAAQQTSGLSSPLRRAIKRLCLPPPSRNKQAVSPETVAQMVSSNAATECNFICPVCNRKQENERMPDFKRHLLTHMRPMEEEKEKGWRCKGVLLQDARDWGIPEGAKVYTFLGQERVGGCMKTFSRRDALKRHLDNDNVRCVGRPYPPTEG